MPGSVEDNLDEFKLNVHNIFTVRFSRSVEFCPLFTKTYPPCLYITICFLHSIVNFAEDTEDCFCWSGKRASCLSFLEAF